MTTAPTIIAPQLGSPSCGRRRLRGGTDGGGGAGRSHFVVARRLVALAVLLER